MVFLPEKQFSELPDDTPNIFKRFDRYFQRTNYTQTVMYKDKYIQPDELDNNLIENNHEECSYPKRKN